MTVTKFICALLFLFAVFGFGQASPAIRRLPPPPPRSNPPSASAKAKASVPGAAAKAKSSASFENGKPVVSADASVFRPRTRP
jgi:hypothetical protein